MKHRILLLSLFSFSALFCLKESLEAEKTFLKKQLKEDPENQLYIFDLANIYFDLHKYNKAIKCYNKSKLLDDEKGWYSEYMIGRSYDIMLNWDEAFNYYSLAYKRRPSRAEPLYYIAEHYSKEGNHTKACFYANRGRKIPLPQHDILGIEYEIYKYKFFELLSISAYYDDNNKHNGTKFIDRLLFNVSISPGLKENCFKNLLYYVENIANVEYIPISVNTPFLNDWSIERYKPCNPSIIKLDNGYIVNCRSVNTVQWYPDYVVMDGTKLPKTKNVFVRYDKNLTKTFETHIVEDPTLVKYFTRHQGLEDLRIFHFKNEIYFTATTCQLNEFGIPKMCYGKFEFDAHGNILINKITLLNGPIAERAEKNWMPLVINNELFLIYSYGPYIIYKLNTETGECAEYSNKILSFDFSKFLGSAPPIPFDNGYLMLVHEGIWLDRKYYLHRFVYLDKDLNITQVSRPFTFKHKGVEMCCGMVIDHKQQKLIMTIALEDREAYFALIDIAHLRTLLKRLK